jgi:hypothetical protein
MRTRIHVATVATLVGLFLGGGDLLLACGDKFLSAGRGTRYQRPKNARAASILIYAHPAADLPSSDRVQAAVKHGGHRATTVRTPEQLSAILQGGRFDVVLVASATAATVQQMLGNAPDAAVVLALDASAKERSLLRAIDKAVEKRDRNVKKLQSST